MGVIDSILHRLFPPQAEPVAQAQRGRRALLRGKVVPRDLIASPLTGERCVYYRYLVEQWRPATGTGLEGFWVVVEQDEAIAEFYLQDDSGRAVVAPQHAVVELPRDRKAERLEAPRGQRASEIRIGSGAIVEVEGVVEDVDDLLDEARDYRQNAARALVRATTGGVIRIRLVTP